MTSTRTTSQRAQTPIEAHLAKARDGYLRFVRSRLSDPDAAEDILQDAILKALKAEPDIDGEDRLAAWFYRLLRNAITDAYRRRAVQSRRSEPLGDFDHPDPGDDDEAQICACFRSLLPALKPAYAEAIEALDLEGEAPADYARRHGISSGTVKVRRHRARRALRDQLEATCRLCAAHGCLDCDCP
jgi:RNA polymerase sigma-70 factor (ECF subfamily)